jgi:branched-chain amino acid transport system ATP-binding protein
MTDNNDQNSTRTKTVGYGLGPVDTVISVDDVERDAARLAAEGPTRERLGDLVDRDPILSIEGLQAGYGKMMVLHDFKLQVKAGQSLCMIGPNGAGKSTVLHSIYGFTAITGGTIKIRDKDITRLSPNEKLKNAGIAYILQDASIFPEMTVEENMLMGGFLMDKQSQAKEAAEKVLTKYPRLAERRNQHAGVLSGGERRLLEISRALIMEPEVLLVDEPSIGLEPRFIEMVFEILDDLQHNEGKTIVMVEQNAKKGLEFADLGYVLVSGQLAMADTGDALLENPEVGRLFLGG